MVGNTRRRGDNFMPAETEWAPGRKGPLIQTKRSDHARDPLDLKGPAFQLRNSTSPPRGESRHARHVDLTPIIVIPEAR